eukprot:m.515953 g.515953  ORF g.515953 m.515953 type:complete len:50 (-) comp57464_c0_seq6:349-498(-)
MTLGLVIQVDFGQSLPSRASSPLSPLQAMVRLACLLSSCVARLSAVGMA